MFGYQATGTVPLYRVGACLRGGASSVLLDLSQLQGAGSACNGGWCNPGTLGWVYSS